MSGGSFYHWLGASAEEADPATQATPGAAKASPPSGEYPLRYVADELTRQASNLQRYPFESATMNEAARMAADALRKIRRNMLAGQ